jgi:hypothetical protein
MNADQHDSADAMVPYSVLFLFLLFFFSLLFPYLLVHLSIRSMHVLLDGGIDVVVFGLAGCDPTIAGPLCAPRLVYHPAIVRGSGFTVHFRTTKRYFCLRLHCSSEGLRGLALYHVR